MQRALATMQPGASGTPFTSGSGSTHAYVLFSNWYVPYPALPAAILLSQVSDQELLLGHLKGLAQHAADRQAALQARIDR
jgi:hypothetical protein